MTKEQRFEDITSSMLELYKKKNADYGDSFGKTFGEFGIIAPVVRMNDKLERIKSLIKNEAKINDESIEDTLTDLANYAIMTLIELNIEQESEAKK